MIDWNGIKRLLFRIEAATALVIAWGLVFLLPLRFTFRLFGAVGKPEARQAGRPDTRRCGAVVGRMERVADRLPWHSTCLVRALAGALLLYRRRIRGATVRFGVRKTDGRLEAHAWLLLGDSVLSGGKSEEGYLPLADLGRPSSP